MQEIIEKIMERINFDQKDKFQILLRKTIEVIKKPNDKPDCVYEHVAFKVDTLFKGFSPYINHYGKDKKYETGVEVLSIICEELGIEIEKNECFILFHMRDLGKFRVKESKLHTELKSVWGQYKEYKLEDLEFSYALKNLMRARFINYRKRNLQCNPTILLRYIVEE